MNSLMQTVALIEMSITCAVLMIWVLEKFSLKEWPTIVKLLLVLLLANLFFWPLGLSIELPLAAYIRGVTGDLSIVSILLIWSTLSPTNKANPIGIKLFVALVAILFYPLALGLGMIDPYAWGYGSVVFLIATILLAIVCGLAGWTKGVWIFSIAIIAWAANWHESANLWDYLLDPLLAIWALVALIGSLYRRRQNKARSGYLFRPG